MDKAKSSLLGIWWISWFGIIGAFLFVGVWEYRIALSTRRGLSHFTLLLLIVTSLLCVFFFVSDERVRSKAPRDGNWQNIVFLSTVAGTILAIFTLVGTFFFIYVAPRLQ
jgi:membrane-associated HD superfamily phosphohydrolase